MTSLLITTWACLPRTPEAVDALAARADADPALEERLVAALGARDVAVWERTYGALIEAGAAVAPELREALAAREAPLSGRAALVLGEIARDEDVGYLRTFERDPELGAFSREALVIAEERSLERLRADPALERCEAFLAAFPESAAREEVDGHLRERRAERALAALGPDADHDALAGWYRAWAGTAVAEATRPRLAEAALSAAAIAIAEGRPQGALGLIAEARTWHPEVDATELEAAARNALGLELATMADLDGAIAALEEALALGGAAHPALPGLYGTRARERFEDAELVEAARDLRRGGELDPDGQAIGDLGELIAAQLVEGLREARHAQLDLLAFGGLSRELATAVLVADAFARDDVEGLLAEERAAGSALILGRLLSASADPAVHEEASAWVESTFERELERSTAAVVELLDGAGLERLLTGPQPFDPERAEDRAGERALLARWLDLRRLEADRSGGELAIPDDDLAEGRGDPREVGRLDERATLTLAVLVERERLLAHAEADPARLAAALAHAERFPVDAVELARLSHGTRRLRVAQAYAVPTEDGPATLSARWEEGGLRVLVDVDGSTVGDATVGQALRVLFGLARPLFAAHPAAGDLEVRVRATGAEDQHLRVRLRRSDAERLNWRLIAGEAPFGAEHLALVLDHERSPQR